MNAAVGQGARSQHSSKPRRPRRLPCSDHVAPSNTLTDALASAFPLTVSDVSFVMPSVAELPESLVIPVTAGVAAATVSIVTGNAAEVV